MENELKKYGIKELKDGLTIETLKEKFGWILDGSVEIKDAVLGIVGGIDLIWYGGTYNGDTLKDGVYIDQTWYLYGTWWKNNNDWKNGIWFNGIWEDITWKDETWENGTWKDGRLLMGDWNDKKNLHPNDR